MVSLQVDHRNRVAVVSKVNMPKAVKLQNAKKNVKCPAMLAKQVNFQKAEMQLCVKNVPKVFIKKKPLPMTEQISNVRPVQLGRFLMSVPPTIERHVNLVVSVDILPC